MSMRPVGLPEIPEQTVVVARAAFPKGSLAIRVRDRLAEVFVDEPFTEAFGVRLAAMAVPMTYAPRDLAIWTARWPTPLGFGVAE